MTDSRTSDEVGMTPPASSDLVVAARMVKTLFEHWQLDTDEQAALLGQPQATAPGQRHFGADVGLPVNHHYAERLGHLLAIHSRLRLLFPLNRQLAYGWMRGANSAFGDRSPVEVVRREGLQGLRVVRAYLDRAVGS